MTDPLPSPFMRRLISFSLNAASLIPLPYKMIQSILYKDCDKRYADEKWGYLNSLPESHRYSIIIGWSDLIQGKKRSILDIGCGEGILARRCDFRKYVGLDINKKAIEKANTNFNAIDPTKNPENPAPSANFHCLSLKDFTPSPNDSLFDLIIFNEILYYTPDPMDVFQNSLKYLAPNGLIAISMFQTYAARLIWNKLRKLPNIKEIAAVKTTTGQGLVAWIRLYRISDSH